MTDGPCKLKLGNQDMMNGPGTAYKLDLWTGRESLNLCIPIESEIWAMKLLILCVHAKSDWHVQRLE
jgi:hypothetical protein